MEIADKQSGDGGLYAELLQNRAFQKVTPNTSAAILAWHPINDASLVVIARSQSLSSALTNLLRVTFPSDASGAVGFGINVNSSWTYAASFYYQFPSATDKNVTFTVGPQTSTGTQLASSSLTVSAAQTTWKQLKTTLTPDVSHLSTANNFTVTLDAAEAAGLKIDFSLLSLFPPTFNGRENGLRIDIVERDGTTYFEGEYATISTNSSNMFGTPATGVSCSLRFENYMSMSSGAVGEAAFMTGLERNADIVFAAAYAPRLEHVSNSQWTPNLISFDSDTIYRSASFYVQKMFSINKGDEYLPSTLPTPSGNLFWSVTRRTSTNEIIIKASLSIVSNNAATTADLSFILPPSVAVANVAAADILTGPATPNLIIPYTITIPAGQVFKYTAPALSVNILKLSAERRA
ncbi:hypothetical protein D9615_006128 [Tricholomella constricta]|uniref:Alpha-L-arabinofuranosidase C-terminal domain-containing protein n=1 Tax=Tricholomella constricta TaxID=117010 RepID=A0A8H5HAW1_9AGAR|nr:hypothetical protein D9615_006128 [Tricholomella constricta]